jgi:hypothetical protein
MSVILLGQACVFWGKQHHHISMYKIEVHCLVEGKHVLYVINVNCMAHHINLVVQNFSILLIVQKIETLLQSMYNYFVASPKDHLSLQSSFKQKG